MNRLILLTLAFISVNLIVQAQDTFSYINLTAGQDQIKFTPAGEPQYYLMTKPSVDIALGLYSPDNGNWYWKFKETSGDLIMDKGKISLQDGVIQRGGNLITSTSDLGLYSHVSGNWLRFVTNGGHIRFFTDVGSDGAGGVAKMTIQENGEVGIGTESPGAQLDIDASGDQTRILRFSTERPWVFKQEGTGSSAYLALQSLSGGKKFIIEDNLGTELYSINTYNGDSYFKGSIGIGTTSPDAELAVNGTIHTKEVKVDLTGWPDYVFTPTYQLPSLEDLEIYINENQHLPGMPSAQEVEKDGVKLGEMNAKLLEKVEEQMLYILELTKQNDAQEKVITQLTERVENLENK